MKNQLSVHDVFSQLKCPMQQPSKDSKDLAFMVKKREVIAAKIVREPVPVEKACAQPIPSERTDALSALIPVESALTEKEEIGVLCAT